MLNLKQKLKLSGMLFGTGVCGIFAAGKEFREFEYTQEYVNADWKTKAKMILECVGIPAAEIIAAIVLMDNVFNEYEAIITYLSDIVNAYQSK